ncbi:hypothetical protein PSU4_20490 [Pseudonocardia sulfidoxydans NBRC 16205]|uniref:HTH tetR-type domain-containing protein n=1 Tax=Pseudonocardia sulfidoxydans NBRC 16205 TaxID=1223511 RepID=A0A511DE83_9PSEU|nr:TetR/AcrR family transcriptional regulator [Pseudonocardia sulfidoxydans]GEL23095.1 hypothetical protein PSU4_20490 [Pseudonocardia sulfidoxydans NBRC 16205]
MATRDERRRGHGRLDRADIVTVALGLTHEHGIAAVTMRRIAQELGCSPMALYRHVADREELLLEMLDDVAARIVLPDPVDDPRAEVVGLMSAAHRTMSQEAWVVTVLVVDGLASPRILPLVERLMAALLRAGLDGVAALSAHQTLWQFTYGELFTRHHDRDDAWSKRMMRESDPASFPHLHRAIAAMPPGTPLPERYTEDLTTLVDALLPL